MIVSMIKGMTRVLGEAQGYLPLPIQDEPGKSSNAMVSAWEPTPGELQRLNDGAKVEVRIYGGVHPPIRVEVGEEAS